MLYLKQCLSHPHKSLQRFVTGQLRSCIWKASQLRHLEKETLILADVTKLGFCKQGKMARYSWQDIFLFLFFLILCKCNSFPKVIPNWKLVSSAMQRNYTFCMTHSQSISQGRKKTLSTHELSWLFFQEKMSNVDGVSFFLRRQDYIHIFLWHMSVAIDSFRLHPLMSGQLRKKKEMKICGRHFTPRSCTRMQVT